MDQLEELGRLENNWKGERARAASRAIHSYAEKGILAQGVATANGGLLIGKWEVNIPRSVNPTADNKTIFLAKSLQGKDEKVVIVSRAIMLRDKASICGVAAMSYKGNSEDDDPYSVFASPREIRLYDKTVLEKISRESIISCESVERYTDADIALLQANQCLILSCEGKYKLALYKKAQGVMRAIAKPKDYQNGDRKPRIAPCNYYQAFAYALLTDPDIKMVALAGVPGSGKTLMSLLAGLDQCRFGQSRAQNPHDYGFDRIMVFRPNKEVGDPMGFLPGTAEKKFAPWMVPIVENIELIAQKNNILLGRGNGGDIRRDRGNKGQVFGSSFPVPMSPAVRAVMEERILEISPINYMKGRTIRNAFTIIDEAEDLTPKNVKMITTRPGEETKVVLTGDIGQIDSDNTIGADKWSNGFSYLASHIGEQEIFASLLMEKSERSELAQLCADLL